MANKKTRAITSDEYNLIIDTMREGYTYNNKEVRPNNRIATALVLEANLGLRISDILNLRLNSIVKDGERYRLDIVEQKTGKTRTFTVPTDIYTYIKIYTLEEGIRPTSPIFPISERVVQMYLKNVCDYLNIEGVSTHSFRKYFATSIYINNDYNIELIRRLLQHSSTTTTQRYIGIDTAQVERALNNHTRLR